MTPIKTIALLTAVLSAIPALAQQPKTSEQQARSYILSAFMTGAAPMLLSEDVKVSPLLREKLRLEPEADSRTVYLSLVQLTTGRSIHVRPAKDEEMLKADTLTQAGKPVFALDVANSTFVLQYDLERDSVTYLADSSRPVAVTSPVAEPTPPQPITQTAAEGPAAAEGVRVQFIEPREPRFLAPAAVAAPAPTAVAQAPRLPALKPTGPCAIKPVMSDQDLVNCGARVR